MLRKLKRHLILAYTASTGIILVICLLILYQLNLTKAEKITVERCVMTMDSIANDVQAGNVVDQFQLSQIENYNQCMIYIEENGKKLTYEGSYQSKTDRSRLFEWLRRRVEVNGIYTKIKPINRENKRSSIYEIKGEEGDSYYGCLLLMPKSDTYLTFMILYSMDSLKSSNHWEGLLYLFIGVSGITSLFLISFLFVKRTLKPVAENNRKQKEFVACASHELRSPLAYIKAANSTLNKECLPYLPENQRKFLKEYVMNTSQECGRMSRLIEDMLLLASAEQKTWTVRKDWVDLDSFLIDSYEKLEKICVEQKHQLIIDLPEDLMGKGYIDENRVYQILQILVNNALSYTKEESTITIQAERKKNDLQLRVIDHGRGMTEEEKKRVFDRYYRVDQAHQDQKHFGLGLSIAKELVNLHDGKIKALDTPGGGATFFFYIKLGGERSEK